MAKPNKQRPAPSVTSGQADTDLAKPSPTNDSEIERLLDEAGVGDDSHPTPVPAAAAEPVAKEDDATASRPGAPTPAAPVTGPKGTLAATPAPAATPAEPVAPKEPAPPVAPASPAAPVTARPVTPPATPAAPAPIKDKEVDDLKEPEGASPEAVNNFKRLREIAKTRNVELTAVKKNYDDALAHIQKIEKEKGQLPEPIANELKDHREFRRRFDIRNDQEFKTRFDSKVESNSASILGMLKAGGMPEADIASIKLSGLDKVPMSYWKKEVLTPLEESNNPEDNKLGVAIKAKIEQNMLLATQKDEAIAEASKEGSKWQKEREDQITQRRTEENNIMRSTLEELQTKVSWGQLRDVPPDATPEQKEEIERDNASYKFAEKILPDLLNPKNPQQKMEAVALALLSFRQRDDMERIATQNIEVLNAMQLKIDGLEAENVKLKSAGKTNKAGNAAPVTPAKTVNSSENIGMKNEDAVEKQMQELGI